MSWSNAAGRPARVLHIGSGQSDAATLNLAGVRQRGAQLGANEVHVHFAAAPDAARTLVLCDLRAGQLGSLASEPEPRVPAPSPRIQSFLLAFQLQPVEKPPALILAGTSLHRRTLQP